MKKIIKRWCKVLIKVENEVFDKTKIPEFSYETWLIVASSEKDVIQIIDEQVMRRLECETIAMGPAEIIDITWFGSQFYRLS